MITGFRDGFNLLRSVVKTSSAFSTVPRFPNFRKGTYNPLHNGPLILTFFKRPPNFSCLLFHGMHRAIQRRNKQKRFWNTQCTRLQYIQKEQKAWLQEESNKIHLNSSWKQMKSTRRAHRSSSLPLQKVPLKAKSEARWNYRRFLRLYIHSLCLCCVIKTITITQPVEGRFIHVNTRVLFGSMLVTSSHLIGLPFTALLLQQTEEGSLGTSIWPLIVIVVSCGRTKSKKRKKGERKGKGSWAVNYTVHMNVYCVMASNSAVKKKTDVQQSRGQQWVQKSHHPDHPYRG